MTEDPRWPRASSLLERPSGSGPVLHLVGAPLARASISPSGADATPAAVRRALRRFATYGALEGGVDLRALDLVDRGDHEIAELPIEAAQTRLEAGLRGDRSGADLLVILGGDNAVSYPAVRALGTTLDRVGLLTLDAHHDLRGLHAGPTNGTPVRQLLDDGLPGRNVVQVGIGAFTNSAEYRGDADAAGVTSVSVEEVRRGGAAAVVRRHLDALAQRCDVVHVDLDVDVLDAVFAPGCPGARPGGLWPGELHAAALEAGRHPAVASIDIVEVDATADTGGVTVDTAALCLLHAGAGLLLRSG